jgi:hypothetical protein
MNIKNHTKHPPVFKGNYIMITDYSEIEPKIAVKLAEKRKHKVIKVDKHPIGKNEDYHWEYSVYIENCPDIILPKHYIIFDY